MVKKTCKFFALGTCTRGQACTFSHDVAPSSKIRAEAAPFVPTSHLNTSPISPAETNRIPCRFHLLGRCNKGINCPYEHLEENLSTSNHKLEAQPEGVDASPNSILVQDSRIESFPIAASEQSTQGSEARILRGASVTFGPGAQVHDLELPSDYSAVQLKSLQPNCDAEAFQGFLAVLGENVHPSFIRVKNLTWPPSTVANVRIRDSRFAQRLKLKADTCVKGNHVPDITVGVLQAGIESEMSVNRLQLNTVSCTWYKPSRTVWLHYHNTGKARAAERFFTSRDFRVAGRKVQATLQVPEHRFGHQKHSITSVQMGNLSASVLQSTIQRHIPDHLTPIDVIMGKPSYTTSLHEVGVCVKALLDEVGPLETWEPNSTTSATQVKAIARFRAEEDARKAVTQLSGQKMPQLANSKLFVSPLISVKFNVPTSMYNAIPRQLSDLKSQIWDAGHVHIKTYPPLEPMQKLITLRLYGEDVKAVAKAKSAFEKIMAGDVAMNGGIGMWDDYFTSSGALTYLNVLSRTYGAYIHRDTRKHRLALYGPVESKKKVQSALIEKLESLREATHYIPLSTGDLKKALQGGFRCIVATFGKERAKLDIRQRPQVITINGSARDLAKARAILDQDLAGDLENLALNERADEPDCAVCWTKAEDAYRTPCGHLYCGSCFSQQCASAGQGDLPVRCFGDLGNCSQVLEVQEIKNALPSEAFERLLEDSFTTHVRTNPKSFQYCPTPDCPQIYRISANGTTFTCPACLTPICTTCQVISHDGMTCEVYERISSQGSEEFVKWKQASGVKDCPVCRVPIEKSVGCNHMECRNCKTHICWTCLETFDEGMDCYAHMNEVHGSFYDGEDVLIGEGEVEEEDRWI